MLPRHSSNQNPSRATTTALQRFSLLQRYRSARQRGVTAEKAARDCGVCVATVWRYQQAFAKGGLAALSPRCIPGRPSVAEAAGLTPELIVQVQGLALVLGSAARGWKAFAELPDCPPKLARKLHGLKSIPPSLRELAAVRQRTMRVRECGGKLLISTNGGEK